MNINWNHGYDQQSRTAAQEMTRLFGMAHRATMTSNHVKGLAIDITISWRGTLRIKNAQGKTVTIRSGPRDGTNVALAAVGASYGVYKLKNDPPHWSYNGR